MNQSMATQTASPFFIFAACFTPTAVSSAPVPIEFKSTHPPLGLSGAKGEICVPPHIKVTDVDSMVPFTLMGQRPLAGTVFSRYFSGCG